VAHKTAAKRGYNKEFDLGHIKAEVEMLNRYINQKFQEGLMTTGSDQRAIII
jgi:hypothetical protein